MSLEWLYMAVNLHYGWASLFVVAFLISCHGLENAPRRTKLSRSQFLYTQCHCRPLSSGPHPGQMWWKGEYYHAHPENNDLEQGTF